MEARIQSQEGILLLFNHSIQVEGAFGVLKKDMNFRRFLLRGQVKVQIELWLLAAAFNINKLHNKIQAKRCGSYLHILKASWSRNKTFYTGERSFIALLYLKELVYGGIFLWFSLFTETKSLPLYVYT